MDLFLDYFLPKLAKIAPEQSILIESIAAGYKILHQTTLTESATPILYHVLSSDRLLSIIKNNQFTPNNSEHEYIGEGNRFMSFSRTRGLDEGFATLYASSEDGKSDDWCLIRLTIDGDRFNTHPNFHTGQGKSRRQHHLQVKPFDWTTHEIQKGEFEYMNPTGADSSKGMQLAADDGDRTSTILPVRDNVYLDRYSHPFVQSEDRLISDGEYIPNAIEFIKRIDILILPYAFNETNFDERKIFVDAIKSQPWLQRVHVYASKESFDRNDSEIPYWVIGMDEDSVADYIQSHNKDAINNLVDVREWTPRVR